MVVYAGPGVLSTNEEFAIKRNQAEHARLGETIDSIRIDERSTSENYKKNIKELRRTLKDINMSTGSSPEGIRTLSSRSLSGVTQSSAVSYRIPDLMTSRIHSSKSDFIKRETAVIEINRALRGVPSYIETGGCKYEPRAHTGDGVSHFRSRRNLLGSENRQTKSEGGFCSALEHIPNMSDDDSVFLDDPFLEEENKNETDIVTKYFQEIYNPWNIRNRNGKEYDALQLPKIKDCHRPVCRPTCNTCAQRKKKGPCFLIPGLVQVKEEEDDLSKPNKRKKKSNKQFNKNISSTGDGDQNSHDLKMIKHIFEPKQGMSPSRLKELAVPKGGFRRELRFSKAFLKRSLHKMTEMNERQQLSVFERENQRRIQSKVTTFLAYVNLQHHERQPKTMVDIPMRDDLLKSEENTISPSVAKRIQNEKGKSSRKVAFK